MIIDKNLKQKFSLIRSGLLTIFIVVICLSISNYNLLISTITKTDPFFHKISYLSHSISKGSLQLENILLTLNTKKDGFNKTPFLESIQKINDNIYKIKNAAFEIQNLEYQLDSFFNSKLSKNIIIESDNIKDSINLLSKSDDKSKTLVINKIRPHIFNLLALSDRIDTNTHNELVKNTQDFIQLFRLLQMFFFAGILILLLMGNHYLKTLFQSILKPIIGLKKGTQKVGNGIFEVLIIPDEKDEMRELTLSFNTMITELKNGLQEHHMRIEAELVAAVAIRESEEKTKFLARMSHEIRTPLNGIVGGIELLSSENRSLSKTEIMDMINFSSERLLYTANEIFETSNAKANKIKVIQVEVNIPSLIKKIRNIYRNHSDNEFKISIDDNIPPGVMIDESLLSRILMNLISNADKFTRNGMIEITSDLNLRDNKNPILNFIIKDNGIGISKGYLRKIYDPFSQEDESTTRKYEGSGLGLTIVKELVDLLKGKISIISRQKEGTEVFIEIPITLLKSKPSKKTLGEKSKPFFGNDLKVLIVEDDTINLKSIVLRFNSLGLKNVDTAVNGLEAVKKAKTSSYDIIFMDIRMPVMNGLDASSEILKNVSPPPIIIAMTADSTDKNMEECRAIGIKEFITKPFKKQQLIEIIKNYSKYFKKVS